VYETVECTAVIDVVVGDMFRHAAQFDPITTYTSLVVANVIKMIMMVHSINVTT